ncbi:MAG: ABC transporter ATP-binding protein [Solirubrobacterales bacterium]|jgi:NitT/TauT family transport system ATP-binding protein
MTSKPALHVVPQAGASAPKLSILGASKSYVQGSGERVQALERATLDIAKGEFVCLIGPSGCGKSTLLNLIAGLERPDEGQVLMDGRPVSGPGPDRAVLFQEPSLFPWMSVLGNVEFALELNGTARRERTERAMAWLEKVHLARFALAQPHELSPGMRQRATLARALACQPEILLADEPFGALDAQSREILQRELQAVWLETRNTFVFVTHNVREAVFLADRVVLMSARPGTFVAEHRISSPRPRAFEDVLLSKVVVDVHDHLLKEVEKVVSSEEGARPGLA